MISIDVVHLKFHLDQILNRRKGYVILMNKILDAINKVAEALREVSKCYGVSKLSDFFCKTAKEPGSNNEIIIYFEFSETLLLISDELKIYNGQWFSAKRLTNDIIPALQSLVS